MPEPNHDVAGLVGAYGRERPIYERMRSLLERVLESARNEVAPLAIVQTRVKSMSSFAEKTVRQRKTVADPLHEFTDLCGGRIIVTTRREVAAVCRFLEHRLKVDRKHSQDARDRLRPEEFGYGSTHFIVQLKPNAFAGSEAPEDLTEALDQIGSRRAEIQVRTFLEHAWSEVSHDRLYKAPIAVPETWRRRMHRVAALLESGDQDFDATTSALDDFLRSHDAWRPGESLDDELETAKLLLEHEPNVRHKPALALRVARLARTMRQWDLVKETLRPWQDHPWREQRALRTELGRALCQGKPREVTEGRELLTEVGAPATIHPEQPSAPGLQPDLLRAQALGWLAESTEVDESSSDERVLDLYRKASLCDPRDPYLLAAYLERQARFDRGFQATVRAQYQIRAALDTAREHAGVKIALPDCHFVAGRLHVLLQQFDAALTRYTQAIVAAAGPQAVDAELRSIEALRRALAGSSEGLDQAVLLLQLGAVVKRRTGQRQGMLNDLRQLTCNVAKLDPARTENPFQSHRAPLAIVAGDAAPMDERDTRRYCALLQPAFEGFKGTFVSGGTQIGIPGVVGQLASESSDGGVKAVGYVPNRFPKDGPPDERYTELVETHVVDFSPIQPLLSWIDLLHAGVEPSEVRVLGIGGGAIAAFEYRLALALGATVGLVAGSGRAVAELTADLDAWPRGRLLILPEDSMTVRAFVHAPQAHGPLAGPALEAAARALHDDYLKSNQHKRYREPNLAPWEQLIDDFKESNRGQAAYAAQILATEGYEVAPADRVPASARVATFSDDDEIARMAEKEHGRWNVERLCSGWHWGEDKDEQRKIHPNIAKWTDIPPSIQKYDLDFVKSWPRILADQDLAIKKT